MILIGIPVFNGEKYIVNCLESILTSDNKSLGIKVIVVDDDSTDKTSELIKKNFPNVKIISHNKNLGAAISNNELLDEALGFDYFMRLDVDTVVNSGAISAMAKYLENNPKVGLVSAQILTPDGNISTSYFSYFQSPLTWFKEFNFLITKLFRNMDETLHATSLQKSIMVKALASTAIMARVSAIKNVGKFDENLPFFLEDSDWSKRFLDAGFEVKVIPEAKVVHFGGSSDEQIYIMCRDRSLVSLYRFITKHWPGILNRYLLIDSVLLGSVINLFVTLLLSPLSLVNKRIKMIIRRNFCSFANVIIWHLKHLGIFLNYRV